MTYITDIRSYHNENDFDDTGIVQIQFAREDDYYHITAMDDGLSISIFVSDNNDIYNGLIKQTEDYVESLENDEEYEPDDSNDLVFLNAAENYTEMTSCWFNSYSESKYKREIEYTVYILDRLMHNENVNEIEEYEFDKVQFKMPEYTPFLIPGKRGRKKKEK